MMDYDGLDTPRPHEFLFAIGIMLSRTLICIGAPVGLLATACVMMGVVS